jgi:hypothetical protein
MMIDNKIVCRAVLDLYELRFNDNTFAVENILIGVNNELDVDDKLYSSRELCGFAKIIYSDLYEKIINHKNIQKRIAAIRVMLDEFWSVFMDVYWRNNEYQSLRDYYKITQKIIVDDWDESRIGSSEEYQWLYIRDNYLNKAQEQIIFNFKPAEIGEDNDARTRRLRRDLIRNLGLLTGKNDYGNFNSLRNNDPIKCRYIFFVPTPDKANMIWTGILKELVRSIADILKIINTIDFDRVDIFNMAVEKLNEVCEQEWDESKKSMLHVCGFNVPELRALSVFVVPQIYCWAPTVFLTTSDNERDHKGYIIFQDSDTGVAEMTSDALLIWRQTVLNVLTDSELYQRCIFDSGFAERNKIEVLQVIQLDTNDGGKK